jgi:hypothetical protein
MLTTAMNLLIALAISLGLDIDPDLVSDSDCSRPAAETSGSTEDTPESSPCEDTQKTNYTDDPPEIYNGF